MSGKSISFYERTSAQCAPVLTSGRIQKHSIPTTILSHLTYDFVFKPHAQHCIGRSHGNLGPRARPRRSMAPAWCRRCAQRFSRPVCRKRHRRHRLRRPQPRRLRYPQARRHRQRWLARAHVAAAICCRSRRPATGRRRAASAAAMHRILDMSRAPCSSRRNAPDTWCRCTWHLIRGGPSPSS
jgi:hypothetical protein